MQLPVMTIEKTHTMQNTPVPNTLSKVKQTKCNSGLEWMLN